MLQFLGAILQLEIAGQHLEDFFRELEGFFWEPECYSEETGVLHGALGLYVHMLLRSFTYRTPRALFLAEREEIVPQKSIILKGIILYVGNHTTT